VRQDVFHLVFFLIVDDVRELNRRCRSNFWRPGNIGLKVDYVLDRLNSFQSCRYFNEYSIGPTDLEDLEGSNPLGA
jgi:hypothetical protein